MKTELNPRRGLPLTERRRLAKVILEYDAEFVVLIGSWARGAQVESPASDIDLLVGAPSGTRCRDKKGMHVICMSSAELMQRVTKRDDFALWCLRYGIPLSGRERWMKLKHEALRDDPWPTADKKYELARRGFSYARDLFAMGDVDAAQEELRISLGHLARGTLIRKGVFPLSRPELADQLRQAGDSELAQMMDRVFSLNNEAQDIVGIMREIEIRLATESATG